MFALQLSGKYLSQALGKREMRRNRKLDFPAVNIEITDVARQGEIFLIIKPFAEFSIIRNDRVYIEEVFLR